MERACTVCAKPFAPYSASHTICNECYFCGSQYERYNLTLEEYLDLIESQEHCCGICQRPLHELAKRDIHIDHDHDSGAVRGILCRKCNWMLGLAEDSVCTLEAAIEYLLDPPATKAVKDGVITYEKKKPLPVLKALAEV